APGSAPPSPGARAPPWGSRRPRAPRRRALRTAPRVSPGPSRPPAYPAESPRRGRSRSLVSAPSVPPPWHVRDYQKRAARRSVETRRPFLPACGAVGSRGGRVPGHAGRSQGCAGGAAGAEPAAGGAEPVGAGEVAGAADGAGAAELAGAGPSMRTRCAKPTMVSLGRWPKAGILPRPFSIAYTISLSMARAWKAAVVRSGGRNIAAWGPSPRPTRP